jgi:hypothetical protein
MYTPAQWKRITKRHLVTGKIPTTYLLEAPPPLPVVNLVNSLLFAEVDPNLEHLDLRERIESKAGNEVLTESELYVIRDLLQEALEYLNIADKTISLVHVIRELLSQIIRDHDIADVVAPQDGSTPSGLLILWYTRTERVRMLRAALAPHKRLPAEILTTIFMDACNDHAFSLPPNPRSTRRAISQVRARWRQVALNEPHLWNNLTIEDGDQGRNFASRIGEIFGRSAGISISLKAEGDRYRNLNKLLEQTTITNIILPHLAIFRTLNLIFPSICFSPLFESPPGFVDSLESVKLDLRWGYHDWENSNPFHVDKPATVFSGARSLRQVEIESSFDHGRWHYLDPDAIDLPWAQLTCLRLGPAVALTPTRAHDVLRQSTRLVNCRLDLTPSWRQDSLVSGSPIVCTDLESLYLFVINDANLIQFLRPLVLPSCKDFTCKTEGYSCEQPELVSLIRRSKCSIASISLNSRRKEVVDEALLEELSGLTTFEAQSLIFTSPVFKRMSRRQLLPQLGVFYGQVDAPDSFVDMLEDQERAPSPGDSKHDTRLRIARVYCNASVPHSIYDAAFGRLQDLQRSGVGESIRMWKADYD